jgi:hypothetical protein
MTPDAPDVAEMVAWLETEAAVAATYLSTGMSPMSRFTA